MCVSERKLADGSFVACRVCWQCRENRINDWVGRCIAESKSATATHSITLTYGRDDDGNEDHLRAALLTYSDVQLYLKLLRRHGYPCRYFAVGEYGSMKGRAHWHLIAFWQDRVPPHQIGERFMDGRHWKRGYSHWEPCSAASIRYVCKYLQKGIGEDERQGHLAMSKKPALGSAYFRWLAGEYVRQGLAPQELTYWFPEVIDQKTERPKLFMLREGSPSADQFLAAYLDLWRRERGGFAPASELVTRYEDRLARGTYGAELLMKPVASRVPVPHSPPPGGSAPVLSEQHNAYYSDTAYGRQWFSRNSEGDLVWHAKIGPAESTSRVLQRLQDRADGRSEYRDRSQGR